MGCETVKKEISGKSFSTVQFPTKEGLKISARLVKFIGPIVDTVTDTTSNRIAFSIFTEKLDDDNFVNLIIDILKYSYCGKDKIDETTFDGIFAGEYMMLYEVVLFVVEANNFLGKGSILTCLRSIQDKILSVMDSTIPNSLPLPEDLKKNS